MRAARPIPVDGSPGAVAVLADALAAAMDGGPPVLPVGPGVEFPATVETDAAVLVATSGSTGGAKLVALSAGALRASAEATAERLGGSARWLLALPAEHVAGVQVILRAQLASAPPVVQDLRGGFRPGDFATATASLGVGRRHTSLVPTQLLRLLDAGGPALEALLSYDAVLVGGAALDAGLRARAVDAGARIVTTYGMSETCGGCVYDGVPLRGVTVDLDADGRLSLGGPVLADGYPGRPAETAAAFVDGRFRTGDLGRWDGVRLEVLGRADDMIITGGENVAPAAVERVLTAQPGVRAACVVGIADREWGQIVAAVVVGDRPDDDRNGDDRNGDDRNGDDAHRGDRTERLRAAVRAELGRAAVPRRVIFRDRIPERGIGKPDRRAVARIVIEDNAETHPPV